MNPIRTGSLLKLIPLVAIGLHADDINANRVAAVTQTPGCVAFWDFVKREPDGARRFTAHVPAGAATDYPLDAANYVKDYWGAGREATYADFPLLGRGPFGEAIRIAKEKDPDFRPFLFVPRARLHDTPLDIKGAGKSVTVVVWAIRESGNHALAGIWHEGTDLKQKETSSIAKVERGQRQYALFAGLNKEGSACGHVSENGASSFLNKYALHKCNSLGLSPAVPADAPAEVLDTAWQCFAMTFDHEKDELTGWLNGVAGNRWLENPQKDGLLSFAANAWLQGRLHREPGLQPGEDPKFPPDQFYNPPEEKPVAVQVVSETADERVELREYGYTKVKVTLRGGRETARDLVALRLNPWWYPHDLYAPKDDGSGGPFTIGRVIHSSRSVGFTGWIGGVAVFNRALRAEELAALAALRGGNPPQQSDAGFQHFITRKDNKLYEGDKPFRFAGANMPGIMLPYDFTLYLPERMSLPTPWEQEDAFKTLDQMNLRVLRTWNLPIRGPKEAKRPWHYVFGPGEFNEEAFTCTDHMLALANKHKVRVIFALTAGSGDYLGGIGQYAEHRGRKREEFYTDPQVKEDYKATVRFVLNRVNRVTGVRYKEDKAVLAWQFGNEMHTAPAAWLSEMAAYIKSLDANHLVAETVHIPGKPMTIDPNIDLVTRHLYTSYKGVGGEWPEAMRREMAVLKSQRPMFIGEFGPYINDTNFRQEEAVKKTRAFLDYVENEPGICGSLIWSMYFRHQEGGFYWHQIMTFPAAWSYHYPGFPSADAQCEIGLMGALREAGFKIQGLPVPPVPFPEAPHLLPINEVPMFSWRGSVGAIGYDIQRAEGSDGPWTTIAQNVSDADIAYRPLFSDTTARPGQRYSYRIIARNESGLSQPSNVVGPVKVERVCLADELQDFARAHAKSAGLKLDNDYNALYAEYLFRAQGSTNDWITYQVPSDIESVNGVAFFAKEDGDLALRVSSDGNTFTALKPERKARRLPSPPGGAAGGQRRTHVEYACAVPAGQRYLQVAWNGPAELDRVEIYYR